MSFRRFYFIERTILARRLFTGYWCAFLHFRKSSPKRFTL